MDFTTAASSINWLSVSIATLSSFVIGGVWYGPLFGRAWMAECNLSENDLGKRHLPLVFGGALVLALIACLNLELFIGPKADISYGAMAGFLAGFGWVSMLLGILYLFEMRSLKAFLISAGYCTVTMTVMGALLGIW